MCKVQQSILEPNLHFFLQTCNQADSSFRQRFQIDSLKLKNRYKMNEQVVFLIPILAVIGNFAFLIIWVYTYLNTRHKERMALLEFGKDASVFHQLKNRNFTQPLKIGMASVGIGVGLILGHFLSLTGFPEVPAYISMILIIGGIGLILFYRLQPKEDVLVNDV